MTCTAFSYTSGALATALLDGHGYTANVTQTPNSPSTNSVSFIVDTTPPTGGLLSVNGTAASSGGSSSSTSSTSFAITRTDYAETQSTSTTTGKSGLLSSTLTIQSETLTGGGTTCGAPGSGGPYTSPTTVAGTTNPAITAGFCYLYTLTGTDNAGNATNVTTTVKVTGVNPTITFPTSTTSYHAGHNNPSETLHITGTGFQTGLSVTTSPGTTCVIDSVGAVTSTTIAVDLTCTGGSSAKDGLVVTNPDGGTVTTTNSLLNNGTYTGTS